MEANAKSGFSIVEVALALLGVGVGLMGVFSLFPQGTDLNRKSIQDTQIGLFAEYVLNGFRYQAEQVQWDDVDNSSAFKISALGTKWAWDGAPEVVAGSGVKAIVYRPYQKSDIEEMAFRYEFQVYSVAGRPDVKAFVLNVWPGQFGVLVGTNVFYTEVYNYSAK